MNLDFDDVDEKDAGWLAKTFKFFAYAFSALTSFQFFSIFAGTMFTVAGSFSAPLAGVLGMVFCEGGLIVWSHIRSKGCNTEEQIKLANIGFVGSLMVSLAATVLYLGLTNELARSILDAGLLIWVQRLAVLLIVLAMGGQVGLYAVYEYFSADNAKGRAAIEMAALRNKNEINIQRDTVKEVTKKKRDVIRRQLPAAASIRGGREASEHITSITAPPVMSNGRPPVPSGSRGPGPSPNGRPKPGGPPRPGPKDGPQRP